MKRILTTLSQKWPEYLLEILVLIIGIYGAFAVENWNENQANDTKRLRLANSLFTEFQRNLNDLDVVLQYHNEVGKAGTQLLDMIRTGDRPSDVELDSIILRFFYQWTYDPINGALRSGISSGEIHLLNSNELKENLFAWEDLIRDAKEDEELSMEALRKNSVIEQNISLRNSFHIYDSEIFKGRVKNDYNKLLQDPKLENYLLNRVLWIYGAIEELDEVRSLNERIIEQLKSER